MDTSLRRHSPTLDQKSFFTGPSHGDAGDRSDDEAPVRIHQRQAYAIDKPPVQAMGHFTPLGELRVSMHSSRESGARPRSLSLSPAAPQPHLRPRSLSLSYAAHEGSAPVNVDTKHVIGAGASGRGAAAVNGARVLVDPRFTDLVLLAREPGRSAMDVRARFAANIVAPLLRNKPAFPHDELLHVLEGLAKSRTALHGADLHPDLVGYLLGELFKHLGGVNMRAPIRDTLVHFAGTLAERPGVPQREALLASLMSCLRKPLDADGVARLPAHALLARREGFMAVVCRLGARWDPADSAGLSAFVGAQVGALLDAPRRTHNLRDIIHALVAGSAHLPVEKWEPVAEGMIREFAARLPGQAQAQRYLETVIRCLLGRVADANGRPVVLAAICCGLAAQGQRDATGAVTRALNAVLAAPGFACSPAQREAMHSGAQVDPAQIAASGHPIPLALAQAAPAHPVADGVSQSPEERCVSDGIGRLVAFARGGANAKALCRAFDNDVLRPLLRAKPPAGQGALAPEVLTHVLDRLAAAYPQLERHQPNAGLFDALAGALFKRLGGHRMREADSQCVFSFLARLAQRPHAEHRVGLIVRTLGQMRHALGAHRMSAVHLDASVQALCQARNQWGEDGDDRFALLAKVHLSGLLGPEQGRAPRVASIIDALVGAARRLERSADLAPVAKGLADAVMEGVSDAADQRTAVRHAASLWLSSLMARGEVDGLTEVCRGMAMHSHEANARAALFGLLDAMAGLIADAKTDQMDAVAAGIASCRPGPALLRQWLAQLHDRAADPGGRPELAQAAQRVSEAVARKAGVDLSVRAEAPMAAVARTADPAAVNALMRDLIARAQAGATPQELAGRFTIEIAGYRAPDTAGGPSLQGAQFEAIAARLFAASGVLLGSDPAAQPFASPFAALLRALVDAAGGAAMHRSELDTVFQQAARLKAKGVMHIPAAETCVHDALFGALRQGAPERPTQAQALEWSAQVRRFFLAARRPADEDGKLVFAAQALARHSAGLSPAALAFMSAGLVRGVTDLAPQAPQQARGFVHRNVADALSQLTKAVAGQADGRSRLAFVGLGAATAFNDKQRQSAQPVLLGAIPLLDPDVREGLEGWMYGVAGRVSRQAFAQWVTTAQESVGPDRGYFSLHAELARYVQDFDQPVASPPLFGALDNSSGMSFTQEFAAVQARLRAPVAAPQVRPTSTPVRIQDPHADASGEMRREVAQWCKQLAARSEAGGSDNEVAAEFASLLHWMRLPPGSAARVSLSSQQMKLVLEELLAASQALMGTSPMHGLLARLVDKLFVAGGGAGKRLDGATQAWVLASLARAQATAGTAHKTALAMCVATSLVRNGMGPATLPERSAALLAALLSAAPADANKGALREWSGAVNGVLRGLGWFGHNVATSASDAAPKPAGSPVAFAEASRALSATAFASVASALVLAEAAEGQWLSLVALQQRLTALAADLLHAAECAPSAQERHARREACITAMKGAYLLSTGNSAKAEPQIKAVLDAAHKRVPKAEMAAT